MNRFLDIGLKLILFAATPWFWFYENFVVEDADDESDDTIRYIHGQTDLEQELQKSYHVIMDGVNHTSFSSLNEMKRFVREYEE